MEQITQVNESSLGLIGCIAVSAIFYFLLNVLGKKDNPKKEKSDETDKSDTPS